MRSIIYVINDIAAAVSTITAVRDFVISKQRDAQRSEFAVPVAPETISALPKVHWFWFVLLKEHFTSQRPA